MEDRFVVYKVTYTGIFLPPYYIGSTSEEKALSGQYYGSVSSRKWKDIFKIEIKNNIDLFSIKILSYHETRKDALSEELRIQKLNDVVKSIKYFNEAMASPNGYYGRDAFGENNSRYGVTASDETRRKQSVSHKGKTHTDATKKKMSNSRKGGNIWNFGKRYKIDQYTLDGIFIKTWNGVTEIKENMDINTSHVRQVCRGFRDTHCGFIWKFNDKILREEAQITFLIRIDTYKNKIKHIDVMKEKLKHLH